MGKNMEETKQSILSKTWMVILCAATSTFLWGSAFPCIKLGYGMLDIDSADTASQMVFAGVRFFIAGILAIIMGSVGQKKPLIPKKGSFKMIFTLSMFQTVGQYVFFYTGLAHIAGVKGSIIGATGTFFSILIAALIFRQEKLTGRKLIACALGFAGVIVVNSTGDMSLGGFSFLGDGCMLLANVSSAFAAVYIKKFSEHEDPVVLSGYQFMLGGIILTVIGKVAGGKSLTFTPGSTMLIIYMAIISAVSYSLWAMLLKHNPVSRVVIFGFLIPVFGVTLSAIFLRESGLIGISTLFALLLVCVGIYLVSKPGKNETTSCEGESEVA